jgi:hypothetical protein
MPESENTSLVRRPAAFIEVAANRRGRILSNMVGDALVTARSALQLAGVTTDLESDLEAIFQKGKAYYEGKGVPQCSRHHFR